MSMFYYLPPTGTAQSPPVAVVLWLTGRDFSIPVNLDATEGR